MIHGFLKDLQQFKLRLEELTEQRKQEDLQQRGVSTTNTTVGNVIVKLQSIQNNNPHRFDMHSNLKNFVITAEDRKEIQRPKSQQAGSMNRRKNGIVFGFKRDRIQQPN